MRLLDRQAESGDAGAHLARSPRPHVQGTHPATEQALLALQAQAGNRTVQALLDDRRPPLPVQRQLHPPILPPTIGPTAPAGGWKVADVVCKRIDVNVFGPGGVGHWWTELGPGESYGWWPRMRFTGPWDAGWYALVGTEGELNGVSQDIGGTPTRDPHHGQAADESFHPFCSDQGKTPADVVNAMRGFAQGYQGSWRVSLGGTDCRTFQLKMLEAAGCFEPSDQDLKQYEQTAANDQPAGQGEAPADDQGPAEA